MKKEKKTLYRKGQIVKYLLPPNKSVTFHYLGIKFVKECNECQKKTRAANDKKFCTEQISVDACTQEEKLTKNQSDSAEWYEYCYGRIPVSKLYEAAHCATEEGAFFEAILGSRNIPETIAIRRGRYLYTVKYDKL